jgi:hypothetical protein
MRTAEHLHLSASANRPSAVIRSIISSESALDTRSYQKGIKVSNAEMKCLDITGDQFHPD